MAGEKAGDERLATPRILAFDSEEHFPEDQRFDIYELRIRGKKVAKFRVYRSRKRVSLRDVYVEECAYYKSRCRLCVMICSYVVGLRNYVNGDRVNPKYDYVFVGTSSR